MVGVVRKVAVVATVGLVAVSCRGAGYDFDKDAKADLITVNATTGEWSEYPFFAPTSPIYTGLPSSHYPYPYQQQTVPADYDGDARTDVAVIGDNGDWITQSSLGTINFPAPPQLPGYTTSYNFTISPVPADYNGDYRADPAWYRDTDGMWFIRGREPIQFGTGPTVGPTSGQPQANERMDQDFAVPADYDGDGKTDLSVFNARTRVWKVKSSRDGTVSSVTMPGNPIHAAKPVPGDYDGVKHAQRALFSAEGWFIEGHTSPELFGSDLDPANYRNQFEVYPAPGDYDGDGKLDLSYVAAGRWHFEHSVPGCAGCPPLTLEPLSVGMRASVYPVEVGGALALERMPRLTLLAINCLPPSPGILPRDC